MSDARAIVRPLVLTITPNPSVDLLFEADRLVWDDANRVASPRRRAGGQGINVLRALQVLGGAGAAIVLLGGAVGEELEGLLAAEGHHLIRVEAEGETRVFVAARERATGRSMLLNPRGPASTERSATVLLAAAAAALQELRPRWVACCGSVPPGIPTDIYALIGRLAREAGLRFVADCDGELLQSAADVSVDLLVPNQHEAARLMGEPIGCVADAARAAIALRTHGVEMVCITLGPDGAVLAGESGCWHAATPPEPAGSTVGAGDAFLAAVLLAIDRGAALPEIVRQGVAAGAAVLQGRGGELLGAEEYRRQLGRVVVREWAGEGEGDRVGVQGTGTP